MNDLIDTTEMYLRIIFELEEEGIVPLRARIAERLGQSGPTVSQTVARMERDGLLVLSDDRHLELTEEGRARATSVMRKHRLAERLLVDVIGLDWAEVHTEACRWEHVMSDAVEARLVGLLDDPHTSPYGNPIPPADHVGATPLAQGEPADRVLRADQDASAAVADGVSYRLVRLTEAVQSDEETMALLHGAGVVPGATVRLSLDGDRVVVATEAGTVDLPTDVAAELRVVAGA